MVAYGYFQAITFRIRLVMALFEVIRLYNKDVLD